MGLILPGSNIGRPGNKKENFFASLKAGKTDWNIYEFSKTVTSGTPSIVFSNDVMAESTNFYFEFNLTRPTRSSSDSTYIPGLYRTSGGSWVLVMDSGDCVKWSDAQPSWVYSEQTTTLKGWANYSYTFNEYRISPKEFCTGSGYQQSHPSTLSGFLLWK